VSVLFTKEGKTVKLRFPLLFTIICLLLYLNPFEGHGLGGFKSIVFGLAVGLLFYIFDRVGISEKQVSAPIGIGIILLGIIVPLF
jgi:uncharacterized membrane protein YoaT (DUF817 family)